MNINIPTQTEVQKWIRDAVKLELRKAMAQFEYLKRDKKLLESDSVDLLSLSVRASHVLICADIKTIGELCSQPISHLIKYRGCGPQTIEEIRNRLALFNRDLNV